MSVSVHAVATITVEVRGLGSWGKECTMEQVVRQAGEQARGKLGNALAGRDFVIRETVSIKAVYAEAS